VIACLGLTGCGGDDSPAASAPTAPTAGAVLPGGGLSVSEAIASDAEPPLAVSGWVVRSGDAPRICSSYDPNAVEPCGEPSLALEGDVPQRTGERVSVLGTVDGDTFVVSTAQG
jgi:hypothetical protein